MLGDFFRINMPYGLKRNSKGQWFAFNREYMPLGWNSSKHKKTIADDDVYSEYPIHTHYKDITASLLLKIAGGEDGVTHDKNGDIEIVFLYTDRTNPTNTGGSWDDYLEKIKLLSKLETFQ